MSTSLLNYLHEAKSLANVNRVAHTQLVCRFPADLYDTGCPVLHVKFRVYEQYVRCTLDDLCRVDAKIDDDGDGGGGMAPPSAASGRVAMAKAARLVRALLRACDAPRAPPLPDHQAYSWFASCAGDDVTADDLVDVHDAVQAYVDREFAGAEPRVLPLTSWTGEREQGAADDNTGFGVGGHCDFWFFLVDGRASFINAVRATGGERDVCEGAGARSVESALAALNARTLPTARDLVHEAKQHGASLWNASLTSACDARFVCAKMFVHPVAHAAYVRRLLNVVRAEHGDAAEYATRMLALNDETAVNRPLALAFDGLDERVAQVPTGLRSAAARLDDDNDEAAMPEPPLRLSSASSLAVDPDDGGGGGGGIDSDVDGDPEAMEHADFLAQGVANSKFDAAENAKMEHDYLSTDLYAGAMDRETIKEFLKRRVVFQQMRYDNEVKLDDIARDHKPGTPAYQAAMTAYRLDAVRRATHAFFHHDLVSPTVKATRAWLAKKQPKIPQMLMCVKDLSSFGNFIHWLRNDMNTSYTPGLQLETMMFCYFATNAAFEYCEGHQIWVVLVGSHSLGKSYILRAVGMWMPPGAWVKVSYSTRMADMSGTDAIDVYLMNEELDPQRLGVDPVTGKDIVVDGFLKDMGTDNIVCIRQCDNDTDEATGKKTRRTVSVFALRQVAQLCAYNGQPSSDSSPVKARACIITMQSTSQENARIQDLQNAPSYTSPSREKKAITTDRQLLKSIVMYLFKMVESRALPDVNMDAFIEMTFLLRHLSERYHINITNPKSHDKMKRLCLLITVEYAAYAAACSEHAFSDVHAADDDGCVRFTEDTAIRIALEAQKFMVATREHVVFAFSLMRHEVLPENNHAIFSTIKSLYLRNTLQPQPEKALAAAAASSSSTRHEPKPAYVSAPVPTLSATQRRTRTDASYLLLPTPKGRCNLWDLADYLSQNMRDRIDPDVVRAELRRMQNTYVNVRVRCLDEADVRLNDKGGFESSTGQVPAEVPEKDGTFMTVRAPLLYVGRREMPHEPAKVAPAPANGSGGESSTQVQNLYNELHASSDTEQSNDGLATPTTGSKPKFQSSANKPPAYKHNDFIIAIALDPVTSGFEPLAIVREAIGSLAHACMEAEVERLALSFVGTVEIDDAAGTAKKSLLAPRVPTYVDVARNPCVVLSIVNTKARTESEAAMSRMFTTGERGEFAQLADPNDCMNTSPVIIVNTDTSKSAVTTHHVVAGLEPDLECTPNYFSYKLRLARVTARYLAIPPMTTTAELEAESKNLTQATELVSAFTRKPFASAAEATAFIENMRANNVAMLSNSTMASRTLARSDVDNVQEAYELRQKFEDDLNKKTHIEVVNRMFSSVLQETKNATSRKRAPSALHHTRNKFRVTNTLNVASLCRPNAPPAAPPPLAQPQPQPLALPEPGTPTTTTSSSSSSTGKKKAAAPSMSFLEQVETGL